MLGKIGVPLELADLVVDMELIGQEPRFSARDVQQQINELTQLPRFRNFVLLGTSIPPTLNKIPVDHVTVLIRHEWRILTQLRSLELLRHPTYGDYMIQAPPPPTLRKGAGPYGNLRYTVGDTVLIARGHKVGPQDFAQYRALCQAVAKHSSFRGQAFSWGDSQIAQIVAGTTPQLGQEHWRAVGSSHHVQEILTLL